MALARRWREHPPTHRVDGLLIETAIQAAGHTRGPHAAVAADDDLELDLSLYAAASGVVCVVGLELAQQTRRLDAAARAIRTAALAAAVAFTDATAAPFADAGPCAGACTSADAGTRARWRRRRVDDAGL